MFAIKHARTIFEQIFNDTPSSVESKVDETEIQEEATSSQSKLHPALTALPVNRLPLRTLQVKGNTPSHSQGKEITAFQYAI